MKEWEGTKYPRSGGTGENTPFAKQSRKKGAGQGSQHWACCNFQVVEYLIFFGSRSFGCCRRVMISHPNSNIGKHKPDFPSKCSITLLAKGRLQGNIDGKGGDTKISP